jgi:aldehyde dehydrogenase
MFSAILNKIADRVVANLELLAVTETVDNGKPIRETRAADLPLAIDHFRYFAGVIRAEEGTISEHDENTVSICLHEPIGVVGQVIPWNFPLLVRIALWRCSFKYWFVHHCCMQFVRGNKFRLINCDPVQFI